MQNQMHTNQMMQNLFGDQSEEEEELEPKHESNPQINFGRSSFKPILSQISLSTYSQYYFNALSKFSILPRNLT